MDNRTRPKIVVVGGGFGGLAAIKELKGADADITLIDKRNHHLFQPLLYQVATTSLAPAEIAWPIRQLVHKRQEVTTLLGKVVGVDTKTNIVRLEDGTSVPFDYLILGTGAQHAYFGHDDWEPYAPGLKTLEDATAMRRRLLIAFERAEIETDPENLQPKLRPLNRKVAEFIRANSPTNVERVRITQALDVLESPWPRREAGH